MMCLYVPVLCLACQAEQCKIHQHTSSRRTAKHPLFSPQRVWLFPWLLLSQMAFIIVAGICACLYFLFLCFMVFQVFRNISGKRTSLPAMSKARRLHYEVCVFMCSLSPIKNKQFWSWQYKRISLLHSMFFMNCLVTNQPLLSPFRVWFSGSSSSCWSLWPVLPWLSSSSSSVRWVP